MFLSQLRWRAASCEWGVVGARQRLVLGTTANLPSCGCHLLGPKAPTRRVCGSWAAPSQHVVPAWPLHALALAKGQRGVPLLCVQTPSVEQRGPPNPALWEPRLLL